MWSLNSVVQKNQWVKDEIKREIQKNLKTNKNRNTTYKYMWDTAKAVLKGNFIAVNDYIIKN